MAWLAIHTHVVKADTLTYGIIVYNLLWRLLHVGPRSAELHKAAANQTNPRVAHLFGPQNPTSPVSFSGLLASGSLKSDNISGTAQEKTHSVKELKRKADQGSLYVLVNTTTHPDGELLCGQCQKNSQGAELCCQVSCNPQL